jgi:hypothetical protein
VRQYKNENADAQHDADALRQTPCDIVPHAVAPLPRRRSPIHCNRIPALKKGKDAGPFFVSLFRPKRRFQGIIEKSSSS